MYIWCELDFQGDTESESGERKKIGIDKCLKSEELKGNLPYKKEEPCRAEHN